eukprot:TRINITY_DN13955_c0_g2_i2.p1 TRINITY_DN13955_c0_g2~~TRINITY_DN13955_c0_g2_i2.p1  ORF type:complete len:830 (+),score=217.52 TRINITY_DN13955_c0_g2_i2:610-3099(+)
MIARGHENQEKGSGITFISEENWHRLFGDLGTRKTKPGEKGNTVIDLYESIKKTNDALKKFNDNWTRLAAPMEYAAAIMLEYLDTELLTDFVASGQMRYKLMVELISESVGFRVFVENMTAKSLDDGVGFSDNLNTYWVTSQKVGAIKSGFLNSAMASLPSTPQCDEKVGEIEPWVAPAALREASLVLKARAAYHAIFERLFDGDSVSSDRLNDWGSRISERNPAIWCFSDDGKTYNRMELLSLRSEPLSKSDFVQYHQALTLCDIKTEWLSGEVGLGDLVKPAKSRGVFGYLCGVECDRVQWPLFEELLEDVVNDAIQETGWDRAAFEAETVAAANPWNAWRALDTYAGQVEEMFDNCFYNRNPSYLWRYDRAEDSFRQPTSSTYFIEAEQRFTSIVQSEELAQCNAMGMFRKGLGGNGLFGMFYPLLQCTGAERSAFAAAYRTSRIYNHTLRSSDEYNSKTRVEMEMRAKIAKHLHSALGDDQDEEDRVKEATKILWHSNAQREERDLLKTQLQKLTKEIDVLQGKNKLRGDEPKQLENKIGEKASLQEQLEGVMAYLQKDWRIQLVRPKQVDDGTEPPGVAGEPGEVVDDSSLTTTDNQMVAIEMGDKQLVEPGPGEAESSVGQGASNGMAQVRTPVQVATVLPVTVFLLDNMLVAKNRVTIKFEPDEHEVPNSPGSPTNESAVLTRSSTCETAASWMDEDEEDDTFIKVDVVRMSLLNTYHSPLQKVEWTYIEGLPPCAAPENRAYDGEGTPNAIHVSGFRMRDTGKTAENYYLTANECSSEMLEDLYDELQRVMPNQSFDLPLEMQIISRAPSEMPVEPKIPVA